MLEGLGSLGKSTEGLFGYAFRFGYMKFALASLHDLVGTRSKVVEG